MTCEAEPAVVWPDKHPAALLDYAVDFEGDCARFWERWTDFSIGTRIRVYNHAHASGYELEATTAGRTGGRPPKLPSTLNATTRDGSVVWTARAVSSLSLIRTIIGTPTWECDGLTITGETISGLVAIADIAGGENGQDYPVTVTATASDGQEIVKTIILPVRIPVRRCG